MLLNVQWAKFQRNSGREQDKNYMSYTECIFFLLRYILSLFLTTSKFKSYADGLKVKCQCRFVTSLTQVRWRVVKPCNILNVPVLNCKPVDVVLSLKFYLIYIVYLLIIWPTVVTFEYHHFLFWGPFTACRRVWIEGLRPTCRCLLFTNFWWLSHGQSNQIFFFFIKNIKQYVDRQGTLRLSLEKLHIRDV